MTHGNQLLARLSLRDRQLLTAAGENVRLVPNVVLFERGEAAVSVFFPTSGAVTLAVPAHPSAGLGVLLVGSEGMLGIHCVLGDGVTSLRAVVPTSGSALRIEAAAFSEALGRSVALHGHLLNYVGGMLNQIAVAAACARFHTIGPRLAGWLLKSRDRAAADNFCMTQDAMALTLGVRRGGVTAAALELQRLHLIAYRRGEVTILDVAALRAIAGECYFADRAVRGDARRPLRSRLCGFGAPIASQSS